MTASASIDSPIDRETANTTVARPKTITAWNILTPARWVMAWRASTPDMINAPKAGAPRSTPSPQGPV